MWFFPSFWIPSASPQLQWFFHIANKFFPFCCWCSQNTYAIMLHKTTVLSLWTNIQWTPFQLQMEVLTVLLKSSMNNIEFSQCFSSPGNYKEIVWDSNYLGWEDYSGNETHVILDSRSWDLGFWCLQRLCGWKSYLPPKNTSPFFKTKLKLLSTRRGRKKQNKEKPLTTNESGRLDGKSGGDEHRLRHGDKTWALATAPFLLDSTRQGNSWRTESFFEDRESQANSLPAPMLFMKLSGSFVLGPAWKTMVSEGSTISRVPKVLVSPFQKGWWETFPQFFP